MPPTQMVDFHFHAVHRVLSYCFIKKKKSASSKLIFKIKIKKKSNTSVLTEAR